jgi:hypothetical protein
MAVDVQALTTTYEQDVRRARTEALLRFRALFQEELQAHPDDRDLLLEQLRELRAQYRDSGQEDVEDIILDAMDILTGWCARDVRV